MPTPALTPPPHADDAEATVRDHAHAASEAARRLRADAAQLLAEGRAAFLASARDHLHTGQTRSAAARDDLLARLHDLGESARTRVRDRPLPMLALALGAGLLLGTLATRKRRV